MSEMAPAVYAAPGYVGLCPVGMRHVTHCVNPGFSEALGSILSRKDTAAQVFTAMAVEKAKPPGLGQLFSAGVSMNPCH